MDPTPEEPFDRARGSLVLIVVGVIALGLAFALAFAPMPRADAPQATTPEQGVAASESETLAEVLGTLKGIGSRAVLSEVDREAFDDALVRIDTLSDAMSGSSRVLDTTKSDVTTIVSLVTAVIGLFAAVIGIVGVVRSKRPGSRLAARGR